jgi:NAD(P)-dependent dehydrogenase (short-subunit alcohol dehydrogenase family)
MATADRLPEGLKDFALDGRAALVLGAENPLGRVAAVTLAEAGAKLMLSAHKAGAPLDAALSAAAAADAPAPLHGPQAADRAGIRSAVSSALSGLGGLDILVTAFDAPLYAAFDAVDDSALDRVMGDNFRPAWVACQEAGRVMLERGGGSIVVVSNVMGGRGVPNATAYCAARGALHNFMRALALEWANRKVRVNMIECGWVDESESPAVRPGEFRDRLMRYLPYRRLVEPEEIAGALLYLVSPAASFVTGEAITIDGGLTCRV